MKGLVVTALFFFVITLQVPAQTSQWYDNIATDVDYSFGIVVVDNNSAVYDYNFSPAFEMSTVFVVDQVGKLDIIDLFALRQSNYIGFTGINIMDVNYTSYSYTTPAYYNILEEFD